MAKYCSHCGKQINDTAAFCKYCGKKVDSEIEIKEVPEIVNKKTAKEPISPSSDEKLPHAMKVTIIVAAILVVITLVVGLIMYFRKPGDKPKQDSSGNIESVVDEGEDSVEGNGEESETTHVNDSRYIVGETYTVQTNLRVREGPDKYKYRILDRSELMPEDYAKSVDSNTTTDALLEKGSKVTCLEMSGNWMRIPSGWICVEDEGEVLVK